MTSLLHDIAELSRDICLITQAVAVCTLLMVLMVNFDVIEWQFLSADEEVVASEMHN